MTVGYLLNAYCHFCFVIGFIFYIYKLLISALTIRQLATLYIAEARALRAMFYFELVRRYGNIAL